MPSLPLTSHLYPSGLPAFAPQIVNDSVLHVSGVSGMGMPQLKRCIAETAMRLPHVSEKVPKSYVDLIGVMQSWARELVASGKPPVEAQGAIAARVRATPAVRAVSPALERALYFLSLGGAVVAAGDGVGTFILDPQWLTDAVGRVITIDDKRVRDLPASLVRQGILHHTSTDLSAIWPDSDGYSDGVRQLLLKQLHRFGIAYELQDHTGASRGCSLVPAMVPADVGWGGSTLSDMLGEAGTGETCAGVRYHLTFVPPDVWPELLVACASLSVPEACTQTTAVLQCGGQRALVELNVAHSAITVQVKRGMAWLCLRLTFREDVPAGHIYFCALSWCCSAWVPRQ